jgi:hypothetical protein
MKQEATVRRPAKPSVKTSIRSKSRLLTVNTPKHPSKVVSITLEGDIFTLQRGDISALRVQTYLDDTEDRLSGVMIMRTR